MHRFHLLQGRLALNLLARDPQNALEVMEATEGHVAFGVMLADHPTTAAAAAQVMALRSVADVVSVGLGAGDPSQWRRVVEAALLTDPGHINQVFPAAGLTVGALAARGMENNVVNALVSPTGTPGVVTISTGPVSAQKEAARVPAMAAAAMLAEVGVQSIKFFPVQGDQRLDEVRAMARAAAAVGIPFFEATGGIHEGNLARVVAACLEAGAQVVIPHVYSAIVDKGTGRTDPAAAGRLYRELQRVLAP